MRWLGTCHQAPVRLLLGVSSAFLSCDDKGEHPMATVLTCVFSLLVTPTEATLNASPVVARRGKYGNQTWNIRK